MAGPFKASETQIDEFYAEEGIKRSFEEWKKRHPEAEILSVSHAFERGFYARLCYAHLCITYREPDTSKPPYRG